MERKYKHPKYMRKYWTERQREHRAKKKAAKEAPEK
jgi:hypothetical protein